MAKVTWKPGTLLSPVPPAPISSARPERYIDEKGKFHIEKCALAAYAHGQYFALGKKIGSFGYSVKKKKK